MAKKYFYRVFYRAQGAIVATLTKGGSYPAWTFSGWTLLPGLTAEAAKMSPDVDGDEGLGDGTTLATGEKVPIEVKIVGLAAGDYGTIRSALLNTKVDLLLVDPDQPSPSYAAFGVRLYPTLEVTGGGEPAVIIKGERKYGAGLTGTAVPFQIITVS